MEELRNDQQIEQQAKAWETLGQKINNLTQPKITHQELIERLMKLSMKLKTKVEDELR